jgi:hypothetical protein
LPHLPVAVIARQMQRIGCICCAGCCHNNGEESAFFRVLTRCISQGAACAAALPAFLGSVMSATHVNRSSGWLKAAFCVRGSSVFFLHFHTIGPTRCAAGVVSLPVRPGREQILHLRVFGGQCSSWLYCISGGACVSLSPIIALIHAPLLSTRHVTWLPVGCAGCAQILAGLCRAWVGASCYMRRSTQLAQAAAWG